MTLTHHWWYLNLTRNSFYILFLAKGIVSDRHIISVVNQTSLGQVSPKYIGPKIWSNIPEKLKSSSPYSFGKKYEKVLLSCQTF